MYTAHDYFFTNLDLFCIDNARVIYRKIRYLSTAVQWLRLLVAGVLPWRPGFEASPIHLGIVVHKVSTGQIFLPVFWISLVTIILPMLRTSSKPL